VYVPVGNAAPERLIKAPTGSWRLLDLAEVTVPVDAPPGLVESLSTIMSELADRAALHQYSEALTGALQVVLLVDKSYEALAAAREAVGESPALKRKIEDWLSSSPKYAFVSCGPSAAQNWMVNCESEAELDHVVRSVAENVESISDTVLLPEHVSPVIAERACIAWEACGGRTRSNPRPSTLPPRFQDLVPVQLSIYAKSSPEFWNQAVEEPSVAQWKNSGDEFLALAVDKHGVAAFRSVPDRRTVIEDILKPVLAQIALESAFLQLDINLDIDGRNSMLQEAAAGLNPATKGSTLPQWGSYKCSGVDLSFHVIPDAGVLTVAEVSRSVVEKEGVLGLTNLMRSMLEDSNLLDSFRALLVSFGGYDEDPREVWDIPEVRSYIAAATQLVPEWVHLTALAPMDSTSMWALSLCPPRPTALADADPEGLKVDAAKIGEILRVSKAALNKRYSEVREVSRLPARSIVLMSEAIDETVRWMATEGERSG
jgi:hypothetical protein